MANTYSQINIHCICCEGKRKHYHPKLPRWFAPIHVRHFAQWWFISFSRWRMERSCARIFWNAGDDVGFKTDANAESNIIEMDQWQSFCEREISLAGWIWRIYRAPEPTGFSLQKLLFFTCLPILFLLLIPGHWYPSLLHSIRPVVQVVYQQGSMYKAPR